MGEFVSRHDNSRWCVSLLQEQETAPSAIGQLEFPGEEPLLIEWTETSKEEVLCGSTATLKVISPGDRTFAGLYTIQAGNIGIKIEKDGNLYWMGTLDPEFYEEPYTDNEDYEVILTFSDFGIFERLSYNLAGMQTLEAIVMNALGRAKITENLHQGWISTQLPNGSEGMRLADLSVRSENFIDEDSEVSNMREVLEGIFQPLGIRMIQRGGKVWVYDLNGIYYRAETQKVSWHDDDQTMGVDKVANNVKVTLSPYASSELISGELEYGGDYDADTVNLVATPGADCYSFYPDWSESGYVGGHGDTGNINFTIFLSNKGKGIAYAGSSFFHILPMVGGPSECTGIAWGFYSGGHGSLESGYPKFNLNKIGTAKNSVVMRTERVFLPKVSTPGKFYLRLTLEMLFDARYNPFSNASEYNEEANYLGFKEYTGWAFVPFSMTLYGRDGNVLMHYENKDITGGGTYASINNQNSKWAVGEGRFGDAYLAYYDPEDPAESAGILGWKVNRHNIGRPELYVDDFYMKPSFKNMAEGQYIPYPPEGGFLEVTIYAGVNCYDYDEGEHGVLWWAYSNVDKWMQEGLYDKARWLLYKAPKVEIVRNNLIYESSELDDVEYKGYINQDAKDEISIDTICGTVDKSIPTAKGLYFGTNDDLQVMKMTRQGRTDLVEKLLIGTLYSQFASRHTRLSGTAFLMDGDLKLYKDGMQGEKKFLVLADLQDVDAGTSEMTMVELSPDEYDAIQYDGN